MTDDERKKRDEAEERRRHIRDNETKSLPQGGEKPDDPRSTKKG